jgi:hypothetical protein
MLPDLSTRFMPGLTTQDGQGRKASKCPTARCIVGRKPSEHQPPGSALCRPFVPGGSCPSLRVSVAAVWPCVNRPLAALAVGRAEIFPARPARRPPPSRTGHGRETSSLPAGRPVDPRLRPPRWTPPCRRAGTARPPRTDGRLP